MERHTNLKAEHQSLTRSNQQMALELQEATTERDEWKQKFDTQTELLRTKQENLEQCTALLMLMRSCEETLAEPAKADPAAVQAQRESSLNRHPTQSATSTDGLGGVSRSCLRWSSAARSARRSSRLCGRAYSRPRPPQLSSPRRAERPIGEVQSANLSPIRPRRHESLPPNPRRTLNRPAAGAERSKSMVSGTCQQHLSPSVVRCRGQVWRSRRRSSS